MGSVAQSTSKDEEFHQTPPFHFPPNTESSTYTPARASTPPTTVTKGISLARLHPPGTQHIVESS